MSIIIKIIGSKINFSKFCSYGTTIFNILDNTTELWMKKYMIGELFSSGGATLYKNPSDQTVCSQRMQTLNLKWSDFLHLFKLEIENVNLSCKLEIDWSNCFILLKRTAAVVWCKKEGARIWQYLQIGGIFFFVKLIYSWISQKFCDEMFVKYRNKSISWKKFPLATDFGTPGPSFFTRVFIVLSNPISWSSLQEDLWDLFKNLKISSNLTLNTPFCFFVTNNINWSFDKKS